VDLRLNRLRPVKGMGNRIIADGLLCAYVLGKMVEIASTKQKII
jgi:hypothetical protein